MSLLELLRSVGDPRAQLKDGLRASPWVKHTLVDPSCCGAVERADALPFAYVSDTLDDDAALTYAVGAQDA